MILGIPNVGKSSFINRIKKECSTNRKQTGSNKTKAMDKSIKQNRTIRYTWGFMAKIRPKRSSYKFSIYRND